MGRSRDRLMGAVAGVVAAGCGLAAAELVVATSRRQRSPLVSVADWVIDESPGALVELAIDRLGSRNKPLLLLVIGLVVASVAAAAGAVAWARRGRPWAVAAPVALVLGAVGGYAVTRRPAWRWGDLAPTVVAALMAASALTAFVHVAHRGRTGDEARQGDPARRSVLVAIGAATAVALVSAAVGRRLQERFTRIDLGAGFRLPRPAAAGPAPPPDPADELVGLTPLFTSNSRFYRVDTAVVVPAVDVEEWRLEIDGMVERPLTLRYHDLLAMELVERDITLACVSNEVGGDLVGTARWLGVDLAELLQRARIDARSDLVMAHSVDGFTAGFPVRALDGHGALLALGMNGEVLPRVHGFPARLVVPGLYGYLSATKWLTRIDLTRFDQAEGYWVQRGWAPEAPVKTQSRIDRPRGGAIDAGPYVIAGVAWAPTRGIATVEVQVDGGAWRTATLGPSLGDDTWRQWWIDWEASPGTHRIRCRATDGTGVTQTEQLSDLAPDGATGWHVRQVTVV